MADIMMTRLHEWMVVLYAVSLVFYFIDYLNKDRMAHRSAFWILLVVYVMQTVFLVMYIVETKRFPILSLFEGIYFYAWLLISVSILLHLFSKVGHAVFILNVIGFIFMTIHTFAPNQISNSAVGEALISELLFIHISFAILSYVAFSMSFVFAILYLILYKLLKKRKWSKQFGRLPSLQQAASGIKIGIITGIPFLLISLILGVQWAYIALDEWSLLDMKIIGSFFILIVYAVVLLFMQMGRLRGNNAAWANIFAFLFVIINFFLGSTLSGFHFWI
ncbi:cytochrome c biogenesis protein CcsA [Sporosarcina sp. G11-34]|uniref:cytochrome c biogenesis protein CcsA n=1 Tax=Sporosarcina sp. G11-34 TaxID=2849605 RepID=UPI0022A9ABCA|nr:cytochrome c biogenesis protein CcsA [Sporosarcina sp. G11-34]MCZ2259803.1 cytochrome c biogenesis protein [Sporosarcina sp. G11-34]